MQLRGHHIDHYRVRSLLKKGGMGEIYLAEDTRLDRFVAIKVIWTDASHYDDVENAEEAIRLFLREAQTLAKFDHPHILPIYSSGEDSIDGMTFMYLVMPYHAEGSLADWLHLHLKRNVLSIWDIERIVNQAASALQHAHDLSIIHQDVKTSNFLIHGEALYPSKLELKLADFGIARLMSSSNKSQHNRGTPLYMAPEQWMGNPVPATDQYALAVMAYELLTGHPPFNGFTKEQLWHQHRYFRPEPPSNYNPHIPSSLDAVILKALEKRPEKRFASVNAFAEAFRLALLTDKHIARTHGRVSEPLSVPNVSTLEKTVPAPQSLNKPRSKPPVDDPLHDIPSQRHHHWGRLLLLTSCILAILAGSGWLIYLSQMSATSTNSHPTNTTITHTIPAKTITTGPTTTPNTTNATNTAQANNTNITSTANAFATSTANAYAIATANANATQTAQVNATNTQTAFNNATGTAYAATVTGTTPPWNDSLQDNNQNHGWETTSYPDGSGCSFTGGTYHSSVSSTGSINTCFAKNTNFANFSCQVNMKIVQGNQGGLIFRANESNGTYYYFHISSTDQYALDIYNTDIYQRTLLSGVSPAILTGKTNMISVVAIGSAFTLFINKQALPTVQDNQFDPGTYSQGAIGVVAQTTGNFTDVSFSNLIVWQK